MFHLDERLAQSSFLICDSKLSQVRLKNNAHFPWIILIPKVSSLITEWSELHSDEQMMLMSEITHYSTILKQHFHADKINIGSLGNIVSQLHIHLVARFETDLLWPHSVWQANVPEKAYTESEIKQLVKTFHKTLP